jgi:hypothetical protein
MTPSSAKGRYDAPLLPGQIFRDDELGLTIQSLGSNPIDPAAVDLRVSFDGEAAALDNTIGVTVLRESGDLMTLVLTGAPGRRCVVEASSDLVHWELVSVTTLEERPVLVTDGLAPFHPLRFYRVVGE